MVFVHDDRAVTSRRAVGMRYFFIFVVSI